MADNWLTRTKESAYTSPVSKERLEFKYADLTMEMQKKTTIFEFPESLGTYVQDLGITGGKYPCMCYFSGANCDFNADMFMGLLAETGAGVLEHPIYGAINVTPVGTIKREDPRASGGGVVRISVTFVETIGTAYPSGEIDVQSSVSAGIANWTAVSAADYGEKVKAPDEYKREGLANWINGQVDKLNGYLSPAYDTFEDVQKGYNAIEDSLLRGMDTLVGKPATLAFQLALLVQAPGRSLSLLSTKLVGYVNVLTSAFDMTVDYFSDNDFLSDKIIVGASFTGMCDSAMGGGFNTQEEAIEYADTLATKFEEYTEWNDNQLASRGLSDSTEAYRALQTIVALTIGNVIQSSFNLKRRFEIELDRDRNIIELEAELYGTIDENLNFLIDSNALVGKELIIVPKGRRIVYYDSAS